MRDVSKPGKPSEFRARYPIGVKNTSGEVVPPWACMQIVGAPVANAEETYTITKPNGASKAKFIFNGPQEIAADGGGSATDVFPANALWAGNVPPAEGIEWGPVAGNWRLSIDGKGFLILGGRVGSLIGTVRVASIAPGATNQDFPLIRIRNASGTFKAVRSIVGIGDPIDPPPGTLITQPSFQSAAPQAGKVFAVLLSDAASTATVDAVPLGIVACQLDFNQSVHTRCDPINGDYAKLRSSNTGRARIVWRERQGVAGNGTLGVQWAFVFIESGGSGLSMKDGIVVKGSQITAATGSYLQPITPGIGPVRQYVSNPLGPIQVNGSQLTGTMAAEDVAFWVTMAPAASASLKGVWGLTDENGITWCRGEYCTAWPDFTSS